MVCQPCIFTLPSPLSQHRNTDRESHWLPAQKQHRISGGISAAPLPTAILAQPSPPSLRGWLGAILPEVCTAACLGLFPSLFSSAFLRQAASHPEPKSQQELSQQPARDDDIPTAFPGKHFMGWNESNSKGHQSQACSIYRGFSKMCQFILLRQPQPRSQMA